MDVDEDKGKLNMEKIKILSILPNNQELQGGLYIKNIFIRYGRRRLAI